jgi:hypothetical protein
MEWRDEEDDEHVDRELPDPSDQDAEDDPDATIISCPQCGADVFDEADVCPRCGSFILHEQTVGNRRPIWLLIAVIVCLAIVVLVWTRRG